MNDTDQQKHIIRNPLIRYILIFSGFLFLSLGIIGVFIPILPTTPFLLLSAACFARSSKKFYNWLLTNKWFGSYIRNYYEGKGIALPVKIIVITLLWITILISILMIAPNSLIKFVLILIAGIVSLHIILIKTYKP
ncbi:MAG: YbaN family protein [Candidatus Thermoplasmatota archaeon]|nr:YbaN family protein [Candidatus Thermoplasmatota archaeon]MBS3801714.1 YbaN family protein [Candidatus Thermoplasmatota archaeon]